MTEDYLGKAINFYSFDAKSNLRLFSYDVLRDAGHVFFMSPAWVQASFLDSDNHTRLFLNVWSWALDTGIILPRFLPTQDRKTEGYVHLFTCTCAHRGTSKSRYKCPCSLQVSFFVVLDGWPSLLLLYFIDYAVIVIPPSPPWSFPLSNPTLP